MNELKPKIREAVQYLVNFFRWVILSCLLGLGIGAVAVIFHHGIDLATELRMTHPALLLALPAAGVVIVWLYNVCGMAHDRGTNQIFVCVRSATPVRLRTAPLIFVSTILTHLAGGSAGREGAALQLGGSMAAAAGRAIRLDEKDERIMVMCGMSAAFSALFGTPLTAAIFSLEVVSVGVMYYAAIVPCLLSALTALEVAKFMGLPPAGYAVTGIPDVSMLSIGQAALIGGACALLSILFCKAMHAAPHLYERITKNPLLRAALGGVIILALTALVGSQDYNGAGGHIITLALAGEARPEAFLLKILFTAVTLGAGFRGGEIVPILFTGATFGCVAGPLAGLSPSFGAALSMAALFCGATNCPISSMLLAFELFGGRSLSLFALCCWVSYMLSGYFGLYAEQKIVYSKFRTEWVDKKTH
ncbi:MAG: chloride channel protein [Oscillospiraceae bacterium]|nr:chloride channel protein [Oscillospiraceae bacterium]